MKENEKKDECKDGVCIGGLNTFLCGKHEKEYQKGNREVEEKPQVVSTPRICSYCMDKHKTKTCPEMLFDDWTESKINYWQEFCAEEIDHIKENCIPKDKLPRKEVMFFAFEMERVLKLHDKNKGDSWKTCDVMYLDNRLKQEYREWDLTPKCDNKELVDVANMCMMIWNRLEHPESD